MGKILAGADPAGASAQAQYRRARRSARWHVGMSLAGAGGGVAAAAVGGPPWMIVLGAVVAAVAWLRRPGRDVDRWRRGAAGEVATAELLAALPRPFVVLHDRRMPGTRANVDHLVIGPTGVWVVDSKSYRAVLRVRRGAVWAGDHQVPTSTAAWEADRVADLLGIAHVSAVVAVHGAGLRRRGSRVGDVRIIPADRLCRRLRLGRRRLHRAGIHALAAAADEFLPPA